MRRLDLKKLPAALFAVGALVGACGGQAAAATVTDAQYGFAFSLPTGWVRVPLNGSTINKVLSSVSKASPTLAKALTSEVAQATKQHLKVLAIGPATGSFFPNLNIGVEAAPSALSGPLLLSAMVTEVKSSLSDLGVLHNLSVSTVTLPIGRAVEASYILPLKPGATDLADGVQIYIVHGGRLYVVTFTAKSQHVNASTAHVVETSWHWT